MKQEQDLRKFSIAIQRLFFNALNLAYHGDF